MRRTQLFALMAVAMFIALGVSAAEKTVTLEGTLVDSKCYLKDNTLTGNDRGPVKECGTICLESGTPGGLLTKDKVFYAVIVPASILAPHVGKTIRALGSVYNAPRIHQDPSRSPWCGLVVWTAISSSTRLTTCW
ncbi:MAG: hypothetical protein HYX75_18545 [Acidobacteria bacterium]|nr:hypothetical protein [Acidobacteriota bacterium]